MNWSTLPIALSGFFIVILHLYPVDTFPNSHFLMGIPKNGRTYALQKSLLRPALAHMTRFALANRIWKRFMFLAIPRYTTLA